MNFAESKKEKKQTTPREWISFLIFAAAFFIFVAIVILNAVSGAIKSQEIEKKANFTQVEASIVKYRRVEHHDSSTDVNGHYSSITWVYYYTYYEYRSASGVYEGFWDSNYKEEDAKAKVGMKVPIYVDDELHLQTKTLKIDKKGVNGGAVFAFISIAVGVILLTVAIVLIVKEVKRKRALESSPDGIHDKMKGLDKPKNFCALHSAIFAFTIFAIIVTAFYVKDSNEQFNIYDNADFKQVEATLYEYKEFQKKDGSFYYATFYKYLGDNGKEYTGFWNNDVYSINDAEHLIGTSVPLYYDSTIGVLRDLGELEAVEKPNNTFAKIFIPICVLLLANSLTRFIIFIIRNEKYEKQNNENNLKRSPLIRR